MLRKYKSLFSGFRYEKQNGGSRLQFSIFNLQYLVYFYLSIDKTMISGAHAILYSRNSDADRAFLKNILKLPSVDVGEGWLIFGLPPAEIAVHPHDANDLHELYLMCDDIQAFCEEMAKNNIRCSPVQNQGWGLLSQITLPGGGKIGVYQPRHARPKAMPVRKAAKKAAPRKKAPQKKAASRKSNQKKRK